jgi:hypothetical protein
MQGVMTAVKFMLGAVLVLVAGGLLAVSCGDADDDGGATATPSEERRLELAPIDELELIIRETFPPQYAARIVSGLPNGCAQFHDAELVSRQGQTFTIRVRNSMPADPNVVCTAIYGTHEEIVELGSDLTPGAEYVVKVNDRELRFTAQ